LTCNSCIRRCLQHLIGDSAVLATAVPLGSTATARSFSTSGTHQQDRAVQRQAWLKSRGVRPVDKPAQPEPAKYVIRKHLEYLQDPLKLADFVQRSLAAADGPADYEMTLQVVRTASKSIQCIVSLNYLIDHLLNHKKLKAAILIYNEVEYQAEL
jgi:hypothetical protein